MPTDTSKTDTQSVGNYDLIEKVAEGGMGAVYRARRRDTGDIVAIKIMPAHMASNPVLVKRFEQEFRAASRLDHPNIVRALDYGEHGHVPYLVMEFVEGESLGQKLQREGRLSETEAIRIVAQVAQGLHRAHKMGLIHRDIKPDNVMVTPDGTAKLTDLGLVKEVDTDLNLTRTGRGLGTPHFMAPEQFRNAKNADLRCDIYALGATLYMMVTGELPFRSSGPLDAWMKKMHNELTPPRKLVPSLSERIDWAIRRAMSADPDARPASCREFVEDLTGKSTRRVPASGDSGASSQQELWYLVYKDELGTTHTVKGSATAIRRSLKEGLLGDASNIRASRVKTGPFENLRSYPEFRDLVVTPAPLSVPKAATPVSPTHDIPTVSPPMPEDGFATRRGPAPSSGAIAPVPARRASAGDEDDLMMPHIDLDGPAESGSTGGEWLKWVALILIAVLTAVVAFFLLPPMKK